MSKSSRLIFMNLFKKLFGRVFLPPIPVWEGFWQAKS